MARNRNKERDIARALNVYTFDRIFASIELLAINCFRYNGLPDTFNQQFFERKLFLDGFAWMFKDTFTEDVMGLGGSRKEWDVYGYPTSGRAVGFHGMNFDVTPENGVGVFDTVDKNIHTYEMIIDFIPRLANCYRTIDVNLHSMKTPVIILTDKENYLTVSNAYQQIDDNMNVIIGVDGILDMKNFQALNTGAEYVADKVHMEIHQIWNDIYTILGIENSDQDKKERKVVDEVQSNLQVVEMYRNARLKPRELACEKFSEILGTEVTVEFNSDIQSIITNADDFYSMQNSFMGGQDQEKEGDEDV